MANKTFDLPKADRFNNHSGEVITDAFFYKERKDKKNDLDRSSFDPTNVDHLKAYSIFLKSGKWTLYFFVEHPYLTVPDTIVNKITAEYLKKIT
jgi:hypothetical protein